MSRKGVLFVSRWEGLRLVPYNDAAGNATVGYGHLLHEGNVTHADLARWERFDRIGALLLLEHDVDEAAGAIRRHVRPAFKAQERFDAIASFVYNVGEGAFAGSTLLRLLNAGVRGITAADELLRWDRAGGHELPGLLARRRAERRLYLEGTYSTEL